MQKETSKEPSKNPKFDMDKAKELLNNTKEENKEKAVETPKVITANDLETLIENLKSQYDKLNQEANQKQTLAIKTQGAIEVAMAQLQGLTNDSESTN